MATMLSSPSALSERTSDTNRTGTRGTKRAAATAEPLKANTKENIPTTISTQKSTRSTAAASSDASKLVSGNKFGFRAPSGAASAIPAPAAAASATIALPQQQAKRRKTTEQDDSVIQPADDDVLMQESTIPVSLTASLPPLILGPCDAVANLWRDTVMDEAMQAECKAAMAVKISASKFDYKVCHRSTCERTLPFSC